jgi:hypothetical protein
VTSPLVIFVKICKCVFWFGPEPTKWLLTTLVVVEGAPSADDPVAEQTSRQRLVQQTHSSALGSGAGASSGIKFVPRRQG